MGETDSDLDTVDLLLNSARDVFAEKGYHKTTIKEICDHAGVNIASVNYHFGSKKELYSEAWRHAFEESLEKHPPNGGVPEDAPARERLRGRIRSLIRRIADRESQEFLFAHKEMANPTPLSKEVMRECIQPLVDGTIHLLREMMGPNVPERHIEYCERSIVSQCLHLMHLQKKKDIFPDEEEESIFPDIEDVDEYAEHVYQFSLAGLRAIQNQHDPADQPNS